MSWLAGLKFYFLGGKKQTIGSQMEVYEVLKVFQNMAGLQASEYRFMIVIQLVKFIKLPLSSYPVLGILVFLISFSCLQTRI